jgi:hypothetical protein
MLFGALKKRVRTARLPQAMEDGKCFSKKKIPAQINEQGFFGITCKV